MRAGVCPIRPAEHEEEFRAWIAEGKHGEMGYLEQRLDLRLDPALNIPGVRSVLVVADQYATRNDPKDPRDPALGRIARYARGEDYHRVIKKRLHALADAIRVELGLEPDDESVVLRSFVDTAPVLERDYAQQAGLGWIGKNTLLIDPELGSYLLLGGILTTLELPTPESQQIVRDHCGTCTRCIDACPTGAITPHSVDARRCISYLTLEHRSEIPAELAGSMGDWIAGCDICQEVCPHNSPRSFAVGDVQPSYEPRRVGLPVLDVLGWSEEDRRQAVRTSALKRITLEMFKRNAIQAIVNAADGDPEIVRTRLHEIMNDQGESELVREAARSGLARLNAGGTPGSL